MADGVVGNIHSIETFGALDGPGIRYVAFLQGCPLSCLYCHNPDSWFSENGKKISSVELMADALRYKSFIKSGGITLSGGEPLLQPDFCVDIIHRAHEHSLSVALDTSGGVPLESCRAAVETADLLLLDIKSIDDKMCIKITGKTNQFALDILKLREDIGKPVWIRHVIVPGLTLDDGMLTRLADYIKNFSCVERVELLPFHKMGEYKWENLGRPYALKDTPAPTEDEIFSAKKIFSDRGINIMN